MTPSAREQFRATTRTHPDDLATACLLIDAVALGLPADAIDAHLAASHERLEQLAVDVGRAPEDPVRALRAALGDFSAGSSAYAHVESSLLSQVLTSHRGLPILLSIVWMEVARRAGLVVWGLAVPGHFVVALGQTDDPATDLEQGTLTILDPFSGGAQMTLEDLAVRAQASGWSGDPSEWLVPAAPVDVLHRVLSNIRNWADRPERSLTASWAVELRLLLPRHPVDLRREYAELLGRTGRFLEAASAYERYADDIEPADEEAAERSRVLARLSRARLN